VVFRSLGGGPSCQDEWCELIKECHPGWMEASARTLRVQFP